MSSRAIRKAQKEREEREAEAKLNDQTSGSSEDDAIETSANLKKSAFALLDEQDDEKDDNDKDTDNSQIFSDHASENGQNIKSTSRSAKSKQKRKKKKKGRNTEGPVKKIGHSQSLDIDEIDLAVKSLSVHSQQIEPSQESLPNPDSINACKLLSIDSHHLHVENEMKRLFGREVLRSNPEDEDRNAENRRRAAEHGQLTLADAVSGQYTPGGAGIPAIARKRNVFVQGKEDWPKATGGGLSMEIVQKREHIVEYRFTHDAKYQATQNEFNIAVSTMQGDALVHMVRMNPWHISSLLQVSEILKQEGNHTASGELIERALFAFGRASHHSFGTNLSQGKARLDFRRPENREFFLASWRYINNLRMRATWRTVFEWARLMFSLSPHEDPYEMRLVLDQYALRAKQPEKLVDFLFSPDFEKELSDCTNLWYSAGLAKYQMEKENGRTMEIADNKIMIQAIERYPWVACRLYQALDIGNPPPKIWGSMPDTLKHEIYLEHYMTYSLDIWKGQDAQRFLKYCAEEVERKSPEPQNSDENIDTSLARHMILTEKRELISMVPKKYLQAAGPSSDPLPPGDNIASYTLSNTSRDGMGDEEALAILNDMFGDEALFLERIAPNGNPPSIKDNPFNFIFSVAVSVKMINSGVLFPAFGNRPRNIVPEEEISELFQEWGIDDPILARKCFTRKLPVRGMKQRLKAVALIHKALQEAEGQRVRAGEGNEAYITEDGWMKASLAEASDPGFFTEMGYPQADED